MSSDSAIPNTALSSAFEARRASYEAFTGNFHDLLKTLLAKEGITLAASESRTKTIGSLSEKISRPDKEQKYRNIEDITDLSGIRLVLFTREDCISAEKIIRSAFIIDEINSINKSTDLDVDRFGYASNHIVASYTDGRTDLPDFSMFKGYKAELQIRTLLQHTWATIDWRLRYKSKEEIPTELRRNLFQLSALLEVADNQFSALEARATALRNSYVGRIDKDAANIEINAESISVYLSDSKKFSNLIKKVKSTGVRITGENSTDEIKRMRITYLIVLTFDLGIKTIEQLSTRICNAEADVFEKFPEILKEWSKISKKEEDNLTNEGFLRVLLLLTAEPSLARKVLAGTRFAHGLSEAIASQLP